MGYSDYEWVHMSEKQKNKTHTIKIDRETFKLEQESLTGQQLRRLPEPDVGDDLDLFLEGRGQDRDTLVGDGEAISIKSGLRFFTAASTINPGASRR